MSFGIINKKTLIILVLFLVLFSQCKKSNPDLILTFSDEFSDSVLDRNKWKTGLDWGQSISDGNQGLIVDSSAVIKDGILHLRAKRDTVIGTVYDNNFNPVQKEYYITTGLIHSQYSFSQKFGYFETRCKAPFGKGFWPAFWLLPINAWPPEIDIFEISGLEPEGLHMSNHFRDSNGEHKQTTITKYGPDLTNDFHIYGLKWNPKEIVWYLDNKRVFSTENNVPQERMYIIINLTVGGSLSGFADDSTPFPGSLDVDYVRAYK